MFLHATGLGHIYVALDLGRLLTQLDMKSFQKSTSPVHNILLSFWRVMSPGKSMDPRQGQRHGKNWINLNTTQHW